MIDLLFIELGAVVTEVLSRTRCTIEPFCDPDDPPTYSAADRLEVDFAKSLDNVLSLYGVAQVSQQALYDQVVAPMTGRRVPIGRSWPGGGYEGIVSIREDVVQQDARLIAAANALATQAGPRCRYQVIASIAADKTVRRYHGFHAQVVGTEGNKIVFKIVNRNSEITYDPAAQNAQDFYTGTLIDGNILRAGVAPGTTGAVFMAVTGLTSFTGSDEELPKLPPSAGL